MMKKIGIVCSSIFHVIHTRHIVRELIKRDIEVVYINFAPRFVGETFIKLTLYFQKLEVESCDFIEFFNKQDEFDAIIAHHFFPGLQLVDPHIKKIRVLYGYAKDGWNYAKWNKVFDVVLTYGPYAEKRLSNMTNAVNIGHPRLQKTYNLVVKDSNGKQYVPNRNKPVLVYCPTWTEISSLEVFLTNLRLLEEEYTVLVKMHHNMLITKRDILTDITDVYFFDDYVDLFELLSICDVVLSDYSGAIFDAMLFRKPIALLDIADDSITDTGMINTSKMTNIMESSNKVSSEHSLDISIRSYLGHSKDFEEVRLLLKNAIESSRLGYEELLSDLYSFEDDLAPKRASDAIMEILSKEKENLPSTYKSIDFKMIQTFFEKNPIEKVAIWGAGELGQIFYAWLKSKRYKVDYFFDMDISKIGKEIDGIRICKPNSTSKVIIAVANYHREIAQQFIEQGKKEFDDFIYPF